MGRIPDRWKEYSNCGKPIKDVPIFAFKTPLAKKYSTQRDTNQEFVEPDKEFTPSDVVKFISSIDCEVVVIVDLTNTFRYYNGLEEFGKKHNIQYDKVKCEGQKIPNDGVMDRVAYIVSDVIHQHGRDSKKVVGIHCTHGVNRTGYLVARYMIEWLGYEPKDAIEAFNLSRGHEMEREAYLEDLKERKPGKRFDEWEKEQCMKETVNGTRDPMNLWTDFSDDIKEKDNTETNKHNHNFHPYKRHFRGNHYHGGWQAYPPYSGPPYYQKWPSKETLKENEYEHHGKFTEDLYPGAVEDSVTFDDVVSS